MVKIAIVWRGTKDIDLKKDKEIIEKAINGYTDEIFINGDAYIKNYRVIEGEFRRLLGVKECI